MKKKKVKIKKRRNKTQKKNVRFKEKGRNKQTTKIKKLLDLTFFFYKFPPL